MAKERVRETAKALEIDTVFFLFPFFNLVAENCPSILLIGLHGFSFERFCKYFNNFFLRLYPYLLGTNHQFIVYVVVKTFSLNVGL